MVSFDFEGKMVYVSGRIQCYEYCKNVLVRMFIESKQGGSEVIYFTVKNHGGIARIFKCASEAFDHASDDWQISTTDFVCADK